MVFNSLSCHIFEWTIENYGYQKCLTRSWDWIIEVYVLPSLHCENCQQLERGRLRMLSVWVSTAWWYLATVQRGGVLVGRNQNPVKSQWISLIVSTCIYQQWQHILSNPQFVHDIRDQDNWQLQDRIIGND